MEDAMDRGTAADHGRQREKTARIAVLAALPTLAVTAYAALASNSLTLLADLVLTLLDAAGVLAVWLVARRMGGGNGVARLERLAGAVVGGLMLVSFCVVASLAALRIGQGGAVVAGDGVAAGLGINLIYGLVNIAILRRCLAQRKTDPSPLIRSQLRLFIDKVTSNLLMVAALGGALLFGETQIGPFIDPVASLLVAASMAFWSVQILRGSLCGLIDAPDRAAKELQAFFRQAPGPGERPSSTRHPVRAAARSAAAQTQDFGMIPTRSPLSRG
ncbi:divalent metal cation (Fe/Co/Zn/Cd) transporter [Inquilinus ginsengisoli]|uniref:cation transporter n=1 Tax=Inquilinus ginsengisoli TaxID=363840 RepID=UPI003D1AFF65